MKRIIIVCLGFIISSLSLVLGQSTMSINYYYRSEPIELPLRNDLFLVYFDTGQISEDQITETYKIERIEYSEDNILCCIINYPNTNYDSAVDFLRGKTFIKDVEPVIEGQIPMGVSSIFYIQLQNDQEIHLLENYAEQTRTSVLYQVPFCENWYALETDKNSLGNSIEMANQFWETGFFKAVDPGFMFHFTSFDNCVSDSLFNSQWGMQSIYACQAWNITTGSPNIRVAVIDKGVDVNHREFNHLNVSASYDVSSYSSPAHLYYTAYYNNDLHIYDTIYHGTLVGGVIFANHDSNRLAGIAPNASLINISHPLYSNADLTGEKFASAIYYAVEQGAKVINNSWGSERRSDFTHAEMIESAIDNAIINNCVLVFSSGNNKTGPIWTTGMTYPSEYRPELLTVGAAENNLQRWNRSMYRSCLDVVAPGYNIMSTNGNNSYCRDEGTSLATPHVSGIAALMLATNPELSAQNVRDIIE